MEDRIFPIWGEMPADAKDTPSVSVFRPTAETANGTAVIICPGGGYSYLSDVKEGSRCATWLNMLGVTAFVLKYRHGPSHLHPHPLLDAQRAVRFVRANADEFGVTPERIGVWGFSAGGHLAATVGTHFDAGKSDSKDPVERMSCRPDFLILSYPVISMDARITNPGSRINLLGETPSDELVEDLSNEKRVTSDTPPAFIFHTDNDTAVPVENSVLFYMAMKRAAVPAELHIYASGDHGLGLAQQYPLLQSWPSLLASWMNGLGLLR